jgi:hypothetical protein
LNITCLRAGGFSWSPGDDTVDASKMPAPRGTVSRGSTVAGTGLKSTSAASGTSVELFYQNSRKIFLNFATYIAILTQKTCIMALIHAPSSHCISVSIV